MSNITQDGGTGPSCWRCVHLALSYDTQLPYLCRMMGIKTRGLPSWSVSAVDGIMCLGFTERNLQQRGTGDLASARGAR